MRNISFSLTTPQVIDQTKDITRRLGWKFLKVGDQLMACEKCQGIKKGGLVRLGSITIKSIRYEPLSAMNSTTYGDEEARREGFPHLSGRAFVKNFCHAMNCHPDTEITRVEFTYDNPINRTQSSLITAHRSPQKILFLDFDGVIRICPTDHFPEPNTPVFCPERMERIADIIHITQAKIVITSDWRNADNLHEIKKHLHPHLDLHLHKDWSTPITGHRWNEVEAWLTNHPEVTTYAILEDFAPHFEGAPQQMKDRIILCTNRHGYTPSMTNKLTTLLTP